MTQEEIDALLQQVQGQGQSKEVPRQVRLLAARAGEAMEAVGEALGKALSLGAARADSPDWGQRVAAVTVSLTGRISGECQLALDIAAARLLVAPFVPQGGQQGAPTEKGELAEEEREALYTVLDQFWAQLLQGLAQAGAPFWRHRTGMVSITAPPPSVEGEVVTFWQPLRAAEGEVGWVWQAWPQELVAALPLADGGGRGVPEVRVQEAQFEELEVKADHSAVRGIEILMDVPLEITVELGRTRKLVKDVLALGPGSVVELDKLAGEPVDVLVNGKLVAKGEVVVIDENFGVRITEIASPAERLSNLSGG